MLKYCGYNFFVLLSFSFKIYTVLVYCGINQFWTIRLCLLGGKNFLLLPPSPRVNVVGGSYEEEKG